MAILKFIAKNAINSIARKNGIALPGEEHHSQMYRADASRDEHVQKLSFMVREYIDARKPGASKKGMNQAQIRVVSEWIRDDFLKEAGGDCAQISAWLQKVEKLKPKEREAMLEQRIKGPISGQVKMLLIA